MRDKEEVNWSIDSCFLYICVFCLEFIKACFDKSVNNNLCRKCVRFLCWKIYIGQNLILDITWTLNILITHYFSKEEEIGKSPERSKSTAVSSTENIQLKPERYSLHITMRRLKTLEPIAYELRTFRSFAASSTKEWISIHVHCNSFEIKFRAKKMWEPKDYAIRSSKTPCRGKPKEKGRL